VSHRVGCRGMGMILKLNILTYLFNFWCPIRLAEFGLSFLEAIDHGESEYRTSGPNWK